MDAIPSPTAEPSLDDALDLLWRIYDHQRSGSGVLRTVPAALLSQLSKLGSTLSANAQCTLSFNADRRTLLDKNLRESIVRFTKQVYEDRLDVIGRVTRANLNSRNFAIETTDRFTLEASLMQRYETAVLSALKEHQSMRVRLRGRGRYSADGMLQSVRQLDQIDLLSLDQAGESAHQPPASEVIDRLTAHITPSEWSKLPPDLSEHFDDYLLGEREW